MTSLIAVLTLASLLLLTLVAYQATFKRSVAGSTDKALSGPARLDEQRSGRVEAKAAIADLDGAAVNSERSADKRSHPTAGGRQGQEPRDIQPAIHWGPAIKIRDTQATHDVGVATAEAHHKFHSLSKPPTAIANAADGSFESIDSEVPVELESSTEFVDLQLPSTPFSNDFPSEPKLEVEPEHAVESELVAQSELAAQSERLVELRSPAESKRQVSSSIRLATLPPPPQVTEQAELSAEVVAYARLYPPSAFDSEPSFPETESLPSVTLPAEGFWLGRSETYNGPNAETESQGLGATRGFENELPMPQVHAPGADIAHFDATTQFEILDAMGGELPSVPDESQAELVQNLTPEMQGPGAAEPGWLQVINQPILRYPAKQNLSFFDALMQTVTFSPEIQVVRAELGIREQEIERQQGAFNWNQFVRSNWDELNQPVASALDGVANRLEQHSLQTTVGLRKPNALGGEAQLSQDLGFRDSNSSFFVPNNQALSNIALEYRQPLMRGAGRFVNTGLIQIASTDAKIGYEQLVQAIQRQLSEVSVAYWELVRARGVFVIQKQNFDRIAKIAEVVGNRQDIDISPVQLARVNAAVAANRNGLLQAEYTVVRAQDRFLRLVYGARFVDYADLEILPVCDFTGEANPLDGEFQIQLALQNRPEILQAMQGIRRASIQNGIAENQLLPLLGLTLSLSNRGVVGDRQLGDAFSDQWSLGDPTYGAGLVYEFPFRNQAAKANAKQARLRLVQFQKQFEQTVADVVVDMRNALREVELSDQWRRLTAETMLLTQRELSALEQRALLLIDGDQLGTLYLDNLLQTQLRATSTEQEYLDATVGYFNSHFQLQRSNGTLLRQESPPVR